MVEWQTKQESAYEFHHVKKVPKLDERLQRANSVFEHWRLIHFRSDTGDSCDML